MVLICEPDPKCRAGRFKGLHVEPGHALAQVAHYIHLNPLRAKIVSLVRLADYPSSSLALFGSRQRPAVLVADTVLGESGGLPDTPAGWRRYADYFGVMAEEDTKLREERFGRLSRGWAIGSAEFKADLRKEFTARAVGSGGLELRGADGEAHREIRALLWEDRLGQLAKRLKVALDRLCSAKVGGTQSAARGRDESRVIGLECLAGGTAEDGPAGECQSVCAAVPTAWRSECGVVQGGVGTSQ